MRNVNLCGNFLLLVVLLVSHNAIASEKYLLNAGDILDISVWKEEALNKTVAVLPDGSLSFPLAGSLQAKGKSINELERALKKKLEEYITDPVVTVVVASVNGNTVHILGKVQTPGSFVMNQQLTVMQALSLAGGLSTYAQENNIIVLRENNGKQTVMPVHYAKIKDGDDLSTNVVLESGDVIVIP
jgi:polysaccharide export outer membrane protein